MTKLSISHLLPYIDTSALFGAVVGSVFYVMLDTDTHIVKRLVYMILSFLGGYMWSEPISHRYDISHTGIAAFLISLLLTVFSATIIDKLRNGDLIGFIRGIFKK